jgi:hypothetical protein
MGSVGDCHDNAMRQSFVATLECGLSTASLVTRPSSLVTVSAMALHQLDELVDHRGGVLGAAAQCS